jgi:tetratricopeptide (TPR) repeat protein
VKCAEALTLLEDYQFAELQDALAGEVASHLRSCAACSSAFETLEKERALYERYAETEASCLELSPGVWQGIEVRIEEAARNRVGAGSHLGSILRRAGAAVFVRRMAAAMLLVLVFAGGTLLTVRTYRQGQIRTSGVGRDSLQNALLAIHRAEREYQEAIRILSALAEERKASLEPELVKELDQNLRAIDQAIASTRKACEAHPNDPELALYMLWAYARKVELLQDLVS